MTESEKLRKMIVQRVQANEQTEEYITELDAKIGMLAKTKITTDDAASNRATLVNRRGIARDTLNLKSLNKSSRAKLELYQELFFILQTQPLYLARLFKKTREQGAANEEYKQLEALVMRVFLFAQNHREEFFLLKLIAMSIKQEVDVVDPFTSSFALSSSTVDYSPAIPVSLGTEKLFLTHWAR